MSGEASEFNEKLIEAAANGDEDAVGDSLSKGADVDARDDYDQTPLIHAVYQGNLSVVECLLKAGANPSLADNEGWTALDYAEELEYTKIRELLQSPPSPSSSTPLPAFSKSPEDSQIPSSPTTTRQADNSSSPPPTVLSQPPSSYSSAANTTPSPATTSPSRNTSFLDHPWQALLIGLFLGGFVFVFVLIWSQFSRDTTTSNQEESQTESQTAVKNHTPQQQANTSTRSQKPQWDFPLPSCGDENPPGEQRFYPVFVNKTDSQTLNYIRSNYCGDAFVIYREKFDKKSIQVVSFLNKDEAVRFAQIMLEDNRIRSGEVGEVHWN